MTTSEATGPQTMAHSPDRDACRMVPWGHAGPVPQVGVKLPAFLQKLALAKESQGLLSGGGGLYLPACRQGAATQAGGGHCACSSPPGTSPPLLGSLSTILLCQLMGVLLLSHPHPICCLPMKVRGPNQQPLLRVGIALSLPLLASSPAAASARPLLLRLQLYQSFQWPPLDPGQSREAESEAQSACPRTEPACCLWENQHCPGLLANSLVSPQPPTSSGFFDFSPCFRRPRKGCGA